MAIMVVEKQHWQMCFLYFQKKFQRKKRKRFKMILNLIPKDRYPYILTGMENQLSLSWKRKKFLFLIQHLLKTTSITATSQKLNYLSPRIVTQEQLSNPDIKKLTRQIEDKNIQLNKIAEEEKVLSNLSKSIRNNLSSDWNRSIQGHRMPPSLNLQNPPSQAPTDTEEVLEKKLHDIFDNYHLSKDQDSLQADITRLSNLDIKKIGGVKEDYCILLQTNISY